MFRNVLIRKEDLTHAGARSLSACLGQDVFCVAHLSGSFFFVLDLFIFFINVDVCCPHVCLVSRRRCVCLTP